MKGRFFTYLAGIAVMSGALMYFLPQDTTASESATLEAGAESRIREALQATRIDRITSTPFPGIYEVTAGKNIIYTEKTGRYLFVGHIYDLHTATDLTAARKSEVAGEFQRIAWDSLPLDTAVVHGTGTKRVALISDPGCGWCRKLHAESFPALE
ncbi:MAG TPA: hypothetical protein ENK19_09900, partial [Acidobacteria bacterium]|nr:hypothetical protein [Acidobacteriota bacterium]